MSHAEAYDLICGMWQRADGVNFKITETSFGKASYTIQEVSDEEGEIVITIAVNGGRTIDTLTFERGNEDHMYLYNLTTNFSTEYDRI